MIECKCDCNRCQTSLRWTSVKFTPPPFNVVVTTKIDNENGYRNECDLKYDGKLWWMADGSMYVYYTPTHWRFK